MVASIVLLARPALVKVLLGVASGSRNTSPMEPCCSPLNLRLINIGGLAAIRRGTNY
eukprot:SAG11_NODE_18879_length_479_cov_0.984211_1_plen_57_part_00